MRVRESCASGKGTRKSAVSWFVMTDPNLPGQLRENRVRLRVKLRFDGRSVPVQCHFIDAETRIDFIMDLPRIGIACELLRFTGSGIASDSDSRCSARTCLQGA